MPQAGVRGARMRHDQKSPTVSPLRAEPRALQTAMSMLSATLRIDESPIMTATVPGCLLRAALIDPLCWVAGVQGRSGVETHSAFSQESGTEELGVVVV
jgi:hypothetical protein